MTYDDELFSIVHDKFKSGDIEFHTYDIFGEEQVSELKCYIKLPSKTSWRKYKRVVVEFYRDKLYVDDVVIKHKAVARLQELLIKQVANYIETKRQLALQDFLKDVREV